MSIRKKIILGMTAVLGLLIVLAGVGYLALERASSMFNQYHQLAQSSNLAGRIESEIFRYTKTADQFTITGEDAALEDHNRSGRDLAALIIQGHNRLTKPALVIQLDKIADLTGEYKTAFTRAVELREQSHKLLTTTLYSGEQALSDKLDSLKQSARQDNDSQMVLLAGQAEKALLMSQMKLFEYLTGGHASRLDKANESIELLESILKNLSQATTDENRSNLVKIIQEVETQLAATFRQVTKLMSELTDLNQKKLLRLDKALVGQTEKLTLSIIVSQNRLGPALVEANRRAVLTILIVGAIALAAGLVMSWMVGQSIRGPIGRAVAMLEDIAKGEGDLNARLTIAGRNEMARLADAFNLFAQKLQEVVLRAVGAAEGVAVASQQVASGSQDLAQRTQQQAASVEETVATIEEMTASVKNNADNAASAKELALEANRLAGQGGQVVREAVAAMERVSKSSGQITDIIDVVNEIAFQTNLLALNASVEAARAGEAGRGFAVVAGEVRSLAGRSAEAAKEIQRLIGDANQKVEEGNDLVLKSGRTLEDIIDIIQRVADTVSEISAASNEQASAIDQISLAVGEMDRVVEQNAALVEETAAAAEAMSSESELMLELMSQFRAERRRTPRPRRASPRLKAPQPSAEAGAVTLGPDEDDFLDLDSDKGYEKF